VVKANPKAPAAHYYLARAYSLLGRKAEAQASYQEALRLNPQFREAKDDLAALSGQKPDQAQADRTAPGGSQERPKNIAVREALARAYLQNGQVKEGRPSSRHSWIKPRLMPRPIS